MERLKHMRLKKSFFCLTLFFLLIAIILSIVVIIGCNIIQKSLAMTVSISINNNAKISGITTSSDYSSNGLYMILNVLQLALPIVFIMSSLLVADIVFYQIKIKHPLTILQEGAERIMENDLDFTIKQYSEDEIGQLCATFESMRIQLLKSNQKLWRQSEERKCLNAAFSHDLRNPVTVLKGSVSLLHKGIKNEKNISPNIYDTLNLMDEYTKRIEVYVDAMSSAQKLEDLQCVMKEIEWDTFTKEFCNIVYMMTKNTGIDVSINCGEYNKPIWIDKSMVFNIVENLIINAVRFAKTTIEINIFVKKNQMFLSIQDNGKGFSQKISNKGVSPFCRGEEIDNQYEHLGMGLYICHLMCEKHGGTLELENNITGALVSVMLNIYKS